jgi:hypothetical protein
MTTLPDTKTISGPSVGIESSALLGSIYFSIMNIRLPKTPSYEPGNRVNADRLAFECNRTTGMILKEFVGIGTTTTQHVEGTMCFGHTEVWRCERNGGDFDGATWQGDVFFPHGSLPNVQAEPDALL